MFNVDWKAIESVLAETQYVLAGWVFGSACQGMVQSGSDLDIAVWFEDTPSLDQRLDLLMKLQQAVGFEEIDLLVLNGASPISRFEAISGRLVFCRDQEKYAGFASLTAREYEDAMALAQWGLKQRERR
jgi:predicted nucleotidyltransferase